MDFQYVYIKKRSDFGRQCFFTNEPGALTCDIAPDPELAANFIHVNPVHRGTQVGCEMAEHEVSTDRAEFATTGVNHAEGGWARDINAQDVEQTTRFKKKVEKDDVYMSSVMTLGALVEHCIKQNNTLDMYEEYFGGEEGGAPAADGANNAKTVNVFRDPCPTRRAVANLSWSPDGTRLAAAYTSLRFQSSVWDLPVQSFVWDIENPSRPDFTMTPPDSLVSVEFNPKESFVLAGGTYRGRVCVFDRRRGPQPVELSPLEVGHADPVYSTVWVNSKSGAEVFTASTDGMVFWWDTRKLTEPIESLVLDVNKTQEPSLRTAQGATVLEYETTIPTKFMIGTEQGTVIQCNRKGKTQTEKIAAVYQAHLGPVKQVQRNPAFLKNFITIGDWSAKVWSEDCKESAIFWTNPGEVRLTGGSWSPSRPSVFFTSKADGTVDVWDVLYQQRLPVLTIQVGDSPLETLRVQESGALLAAGSADGQITLLELSDGLVDSGKNDRLVLTAMFERETRREKILEGKNREARLLKKMKEGGSAVSERPSTIAPTLTASARLEKEQTELELIEDAQTSFFDTVCKVKSARREVQLAQMAEKGVTAELDGADFQAPDISPDVPKEPQDAASGAALSGSASRKLASKTSSVGATAKTSSVAAAKASSIAAAKSSSIAAAKASSIAAASKTSFTAATKKSSLAAAKKSSAAAAAAEVASAAATRASSTAAAAVSSSPTDDSGSVTAETAGSSSLVTAPGDSEQPALGRALSVAEQIARVVDSLEEAVDDLLDPSRDETTEDTTGVTDDTTGETES